MNLQGCRSQFDAQNRRGALVICRGADVNTIEVECSSHAGKARAVEPNTFNDYKLTDTYVCSFDRRVAVATLARPPRTRILVLAGS